MPPALKKLVHRREYEITQIMRVLSLSSSPFVTPPRLYADVARMDITWSATTLAESTLTLSPLFLFILDKRE